MGPKHKGKESYFNHHKHIKHFLIFSLLVIIAIFGLSAYSKLKVSQAQSKLQPFYNTQNLLVDGTPGEVVRQEPLNIAVAGGRGLRILYRTQNAAGINTFSSGMVFVPDVIDSTKPAPIVAWAHGTIGMGDACAPSRTKNPVENIGWVSDMLKKGWIVSATDYAGLGTAGSQAYLVGAAEAHDVLNSVRAARTLLEFQASNKFMVWGHSQGGHSALFTSSMARDYAPELELVGTVASAPAAELVPLLNEQYNTTVAWVIGPEVAVSWPKIYPNLNIDNVASKAGRKIYQKMAYQCIAQATLEGLVRNQLKQKFFTADPTENAAWKEAAIAETAPILKPEQPLLVSESTADQVVLPNTTAAYIQRACNANSNLTSMWLADVGHIKLAPTISPYVISWFEDRLNGELTNPTCDEPLPVAPATF